MQVRGLLIAAVLLAALAGGVYWSNKAEEEKAKNPSSDSTPKLVSIPEDQITGIEIKRLAGETTAIKRDGEKWAMTAPEALPVDADSAKSLLSSAASLASDKIVEEKAPADYGTFGLGSAALEVTLTKKDGKAVKVMIGDETATGGGFYARTDADGRVFTIASFNKTALDKTSKDLRDKRLLTFESEKLTRVELTAKGQTMEFGKNNANEWTLLKPKPYRADNFGVEDLVRKLKEAKMDLSAGDEEQKKFASAFAGAAPVAVAKATDATGTQTIEVRQASDKTYYARSSAVDGFHKVDSGLGDGLNKGIDDFRNKKLFDFGFNDPSKVEVKDGAKAFSFSKSGENWTSGGKKMDSGQVQNLIDKLRDLSSIKFFDAGFTTQMLEVSVVSNDNKRTETVQVSKTADNRYLARRANEPALYEIDGRTVEDIQKAAADVKEPAPPAPPASAPKK
ncbi:MAG: DUF4340 domain-containing protein [Acidobacteria bacterium]|nr:DUF4340 domain-containing protein [Acidobacteriota bacterium]